MDSRVRGGVQAGGANAGNPGGGRQAMNTRSLILQNKRFEAGNQTKEAKCKLV